MSINRNDFLESFARSTSSLNLICLNHSGIPTRLLTDITSISLLADKKAVDDFINYCKDHPLVKEIIIYPHYRRATAIVSFNDGSELNFTLLRQMIRKTLVCLDLKEVRSKAFVNEFGMLAPAHEHHYEFMILNCQFSKYVLADRYRNYFATFDLSTRATIFKYIQSRYSMVFNTLEDLYEPKPNTLLTIMIGLRATSKNTLLRMFLRSIEQLLFNIFGMITKRPSRISAESRRHPEAPSTTKKRTAGQAIL